MRDVYMKLRGERNHEEGASLVMAIIMLTVLAGLVATMSLVTVALAQSTIAVRDATYFDIAANSAVTDAVNRLNNLTEGESAEDFLGLGNVVTGVVEGNEEIHWRWYLMEVGSWDQVNWYDVVATGYRHNADDPNSARTVVARLRPFPTPGARAIGNSIFYRPTIESVFSWGFLGSERVSLTGNTHVSSYNSSFEPEWLAASLASNGSIEISEDATVNALTFLNEYEGHSTPQRCSGHPICGNSMASSKNRFGLDLSVVSEWVGIACGNEPGAYDSVQGSTISLSVNNVNCFQDVSLEGEVDIEWLDATPTAEHPARIYLQGDLTFAPGTKFNAGSGLERAIGVQFFASGTQVRIGLAGDETPVLPGEGVGETDVRAMIAADKAACSIGSGRYWGALACNQVATIEDDARLLWDYATTKMAMDGPAHQRVYEVVSVRQDVLY